VFNEYNRILIQAKNQDNGAQYGYGTHASRVARASGNNIIVYIYGDISDGFLSTYSQQMVTGGGLGDGGSFCIGFDSVTCANGVFANISNNNAAPQGIVLQCTQLFTGVLGSHTLFASEDSNQGTTIYDGSAVATLMAYFRM
jgi:hypothetical protein